MVARPMDAESLPPVAATSVDDGPVVLPEVPPPADKPASAAPGPVAEEPAAPKAGDGEPAESR